MNVDEAIETATAYLAHEQEGEPLFEAEEVAITLAKEVERLREALFKMQQAAIRLVGHIDEAKAELAEAKAKIEQLRAEYISTQRTLIDTWERAEVLEKELAAAKAASVLPVEVVDCDPDYERTATVVLWSNADAQRFADWLRERMKERGER